MKRAVWPNFPNSVYSSRTTPLFFSCNTPFCFTVHCQILLQNSIYSNFDGDMVENETAKRTKAAVVLRRKITYLLVASQQRMSGIR
ncbi:unnamed protein product [Caenorhabditis nigoni]